MMFEDSVVTSIISRCAKGQNCEASRSLISLGALDWVSSIKIQYCHDPFLSVVALDIKNVLEIVILFRQIECLVVEMDIECWTRE